MKNSENEAELFSKSSLAGPVVEEKKLIPYSVVSLKLLWDFLSLFR